MSCRALQDPIGRWSYACRLRSCTGRTTAAPRRYDDVSRASSKPRFNSSSASRAHAPPTRATASWKTWSRRAVTVDHVGSRASTRRDYDVTRTDIGLDHVATTPERHREYGELFPRDDSATSGSRRSCDADGGATVSLDSTWCRFSCTWRRECRRRRASGRTSTTAHRGGCLRCSTISRSRWWPAHSGWEATWMRLSSTTASRSTTSSPSATLATSSTGTSSTVVGDDILCWHKQFHASPIFPIVYHE